MSDLFCPYWSLTLYFSSALLNTLILVLIPTVVDLVAAVDPLVQSTLNQVNYLVDALGLNGLLATLGL
jgi:hypothetical protein